MCIAIPGKVLKTDGVTAEVDFRGNTVKVNVTETISRRETESLQTDLQVAKNKWRKHHGINLDKHQIEADPKFIVINYEGVMEIELANGKDPIEWVKNYYSNEYQMELTNENIKIESRGN